MWSINFGIPVDSTYNWTDQEILQAKHMQDTFEEILTNSGATLVGNKNLAGIPNTGLAASWTNVFTK